MRAKRKSLAVRRYLASVYVLRGYKVAKPIAIKYGVRPRDLCQIAKDVLGHYRTIYYARNPFVEFESYRFDPRFIGPIRLTKTQDEAMAA